jgi:two-component system response regulator HydG
MKQYNILVVDDNKNFIETVKIALRSFNVYYAFTPEEAKPKLEKPFDLVLLDLVFDESHPDNLQGLNFLSYIDQIFPDLPVVVMTNYSSTEITVNVIKSGAIDFFNKKDLKWSEWKNRLENYCRNSYCIRELKSRTIELGQKTGEPEIIGRSEGIEFIRNRLRDLAENSEDVNILLTGETGTGKNLSAKYFRNFSTRKDKSYIEFSISEIPETSVESTLFGHIKGAFPGADNDRKGLFEEANGGILFLDEIGDYDLKIQRKIIRFIDDKIITPVGSNTTLKLDLQLIMATNQNIPHLIEKGVFREDLYQRINRIKIELPTLRNRKNDIPELAGFFFQYFKIKEKTNLTSISNEVYDILNIYDWPGNIRELQSVIWDACTHARMLKDTVLKKKHLKQDLLTDASTGKPDKIDKPELEQKKAMIELEEIDKALEKTYGNKTEAAKLLNLTPDQIRYKLIKYGKINPAMVNKFLNIIKHYRKIN